LPRSIRSAGEADGGAGEEIVRRSAPAKVNLYLHITGKRPDGYHLLDSLIVFADLGDVVEMRRAAALSLKVEGPFGDAVPAGDDNLVLRAARTLAEAAGIAPRAAIRLEKNLPAAAGLGGGSADAAAVLLGLRELWRVDLGDLALSRLALDLGADVPVCLGGSAAFVGGIGERLAPAPPLPVVHLVLITPPVAVETARIFAAFAGPMSAPGRFQLQPADPAALVEVLAERHNDLTTPALGVAPVIADVLGFLERQAGCLLSRMSGSGATCFGIFADHAAATEAQAAATAEHPDWWTAVGSTTGDLPAP
jgi:4-diphosphocytidyl-2-C-methyl-D-erythritol kinase